MDCTSRLLFPSLGFRNKIRAYDDHGEWQLLYRRSSEPALPLGELVGQLCGCPPLCEKKIIEQYSDSAGLITPCRYMSLKLHMRIRERY